jgi:hypothetical protein
MELEFPRQIFKKDSNIKFNENPSRGSLIVPRTDGRTDRHDEPNRHFLQLWERALREKCIETGFKN